MHRKTQKTKEEFSAPPSQVTAKPEPQPSPRESYGSLSLSDRSTFVARPPFQTEFLRGVSWVKPSINFQSWKLSSTRISSSGLKKVQNKFSIRHARNGSLHLNTKRNNCNRTLKHFSWDCSACLWSSSL